MGVGITTGIDRVRESIGVLFCVIGFCDPTIIGGGITTGIDRVRYLIGFCFV